MKKDYLLKNIAQSGYNIGFAAKKHLATYDIVEKGPSLIGFVSIAFGIFSLAIDDLSTKVVSATFIVLGVMALYIGFYSHEKDNYSEVGNSLTQLFNDLKKLYFRLKSDMDHDLSQYEQQLEDIEKQFYTISISKQALLSDWYAHYKLFWQHQIDWLDEELNFKFWRDKLPLSLAVTAMFILIIGIFYLIDLSTCIEFLTEIGD